jgi:hypothetical protein
MPVTLSMSVLNIFQISRERLFTFFHDNDHNDALSLTDRKYAPLCMYSILLTIDAQRNFFFKKKPKNRTDTAVLKKTDTENRTDIEKILSEIPKTVYRVKNPTPTQKSLK